MSSDPSTNEAFAVTDIRFEHRSVGDSIGIGDASPRISWRFSDAPEGFKQQKYEVEVYDSAGTEKSTPIHTAQVDSEQTVLIPWPLNRPLKSKEGVYVRIRSTGANKSLTSSWSQPAYVEAGLLQRDDWKCRRINTSSEQDSSKPRPEELYRKQFAVQSGKKLVRARLYITAQGVFEAVINGHRVGDHFLSPGWTVYSDRLLYETFDVLDLMSQQNEQNCIGVRVAEGWFCGRLSFQGGKRNIWGDQTALMAQLELTYDDNSVDTIVTDETWSVAEGPTRLAEIYNGEKYDATLDLPGWTTTTMSDECAKAFLEVKAIDLPPVQVSLLALKGGAIRRLHTVGVLEVSTSPSGKTILDFGQNLVGYVRIKHLKAQRGEKVSLFHAEVLEAGECARRPLRHADQLDEYTCSGHADGETWEPRFTFHGFRYVQLEGWQSDIDPKMAIEAVVCYTDMQDAADFNCSNEMLERLHKNIRWGMRGNFLGIPSDCPQRDERLGWTGDIALFSSTACYLYDCIGMLSSWLEDLAVEQRHCGGIPPIVVPDTLKGGFLPNAPPAAIWGDVATILPWTLYQESGDASILAAQYESMESWVKNIPRDTEHNRKLYNATSFQFGDWLDPSAPPDAPFEAKTDRYLIANAFLVRSLEIMRDTAAVLGKTQESEAYAQEAETVRREFADEYVTKNGRLASDTQAGYALAICFKLYPEAKQLQRAGDRLAELARSSGFKIATGFAGTPFVCEALYQTGHQQIAYRMLLEDKCPSWLYPVTMGATTMWERWNSMMPDGTINPGEMTSFNHYALGAVATFMHERLAGLRSTAPGWKRIEFQPFVGGEFTHASTSHLTPYGWAHGEWKIVGENIEVAVEAPPGTTIKVSIPTVNGEVSVEERGSGEWKFSKPYRTYDWPPKALTMFDAA